MAKPEVEEFQLYFSRVRPIYHQLFNIAHAITGNCEQAEYCLQYAMLERWSAGESTASRHGFREGLRSSVTRSALKLPPAEEFDWNGLQSEPENADTLTQLISQEGGELRRILALRYGCSLSLRRIARILNTDSGRVHTLLHRFEVRTCRRLPAGDRRRFDVLMTHCVRSQFVQPSPLAPEMGGLFRAFQADASGVSRSSRLPARILRIVLAAVLAIFCIVAFWLAAVLLQPAVLEDPVAQPSIVESVS